jgi:hypothetical protein
MSSNTATQTRSPSRTRLAAVAALALAGVLAASAVNAQEVTSRGPTRLEFRPFVGAYIPTGDQRDLLQDAVLVGAQASYALLPQLALTGTFGWSPSKDRITAGDPTLDIYQYDLGAEARAPSWYRSEFGGWDFTPFAGLGVGGRTYNYRDLDVGSKTDVAGYGALGGELGIGRIGVRLEARDYVSRFTPLTGGGDAKTRNDVTVAAGLTLKF